MMRRDRDKEIQISRLRRVQYREIARSSEIKRIRRDRWIRRKEEINWMKRNGKMMKEIDVERMKRVRDKENKKRKR